MSDYTDDDGEEPELPLEEGQMVLFPRTVRGQELLEALLAENDGNVELALVDACEKLAVYETTVSHGLHRGMLTPGFHITKRETNQ